MIRRVFIELIILLSLLMFCGIYGAVTVRDAAQQGTRSSTTEAGAPLVIPEQQSQPAIAQPDQTVKTSRVQQKAEMGGQSFSGKVSRFFLWLVSLIAGMIEGLMQAFF
ncbi:MAG: hypothetical protein ABF651_04725 [Sporolactobacillus sp.]